MFLLFLFYRSDQAPASGLLGAPLSQGVDTLKEHYNSVEEEIVKLSEVFPVKNVDQRTKVSNFFFKFQDVQGNDLRK